MKKNEFSLERRAQRLAGLLAVVANPVRRRMLEIMLKGEIGVGALSAEIGLSPSATSQHLARMRASHLVSFRSDAQSKFYTFAWKKAELVERIFQIADEFEKPARLGSTH